MNTARTPVEARTPRIERLARLPVFFALCGKRVLVAGGTSSAAWKAELLAAAGAEVHVFADSASEEMRALAADPPGGAIVLHRRSWQERDLGAMTLAVAALEDDEAPRFAAAARLAGVPLNVIDKPAFCDFTFGSIVNRSPLVIGISTDGAAPVFAQAIRAKLEALIPRGFARWAEAARRWRSDVMTSGWSAALRRRFWRSFVTAALNAPDHAPVPADFRRIAAEACSADTLAGAGSVTLVGAGPGDPELLTLRAVRALQSADVILIDDLVAPAILDFARREAKKLMVGKTGFAPSCRQQEINELMIALAKGGRQVVRLKGGDPMIFGRAGEEIDACRRAGIAVEVVPGISAAQGAASRIAVSMTHRKLARRIQYITGHGANGRLPDDIDWSSLADPMTTTIVYMPRRTLAELAARAQEKGLPPDTPAVAVIAATQPDQTVIIATIATIAGRLSAAVPQGPALIMIGRSLALAADARSEAEFAALSLPPARPLRSPASSAQFRRQ